MAESPTMLDVARKAGVSQPTVSQALGSNPGKYRISAATVKRVRAMARKMGYRPNASARAVRAGRFGNVALVLSAHPGHSYLPQETLTGICQALAERDLHLTMAQLPDEKLTDAGVVPRVLSELCSDGMLINYTDHIPDRMIELIEESGQPAVWLNRKHDHDCVYPDDLAIGRMATKRLLGAGHRRIAYVDWGAGWKQLESAHYSQRDRQAGYEAVMAAAGFKPWVIRREDSSVCRPLKVLYQAMADVLGRDDRPTAFVTYSRVCAQLIADAARSRDLRVPEDVSLVTVCFQQEVTARGLEVSFVNTPTREYGMAGVEALLEKIDNPAMRLEPRAVEPTEFREGETIAPPRRGEE